MPTFPKARYVFSKPDFDAFYALDKDPKEGPAEMGTFRECVLPIVEAGRADMVTGPHRLDEHFEIIPAPGHSPGHVVFRLESGGAQAVFLGDVFHHLLQVYYPHWNFPKNSDAAQARVSRRKVLDLSAPRPAPSRCRAMSARRSQDTSRPMRRVSCPNSDEREGCVGWVERKRNPSTGASIAKVMGFGLRPLPILQTPPPQKETPGAGPGGSRSFALEGRVRTGS